MPIEEILKKLQFQKRRKQVVLTAAILLTLLCILFGYRSYRTTQSNEDKEILTDTLTDLAAIQKRGELIVLTMYGPTSYFNYRDEMMGFQYELSKQFAQFLGVKLNVKVAPNIREMQRMLLQGEGDLIAYTLPITNDRKDSLLFCGEEMITHQVLVQRKSDSTLTDVTQLIGKEVYVKPGKFETRLRNLDKELDGGIKIHEMDNDSITAEDLILQVSEGKIPYTVCENDMAKLNRTYYNNLNVDLAISFDQRSSWAVRKDEPLLAKAANEWYKSNVKSSAYLRSAKRYFEQNKVPAVKALMLNPKAGKISIYDHLFKQYAEPMNFDWRLIASLAYQESNFDPTVVSWAGARGLMQLMPRTARMLGIPDGEETDPEQSIRAATKYMDMMSKQFHNVPNLGERMNFMLAAYNAGLGHIQDAMALAEKHGYNKYVWHDNVEKFILLKSHEEYYTDPVCKNGYFRGTETYNFVRQVKARFEEYKKHIKR